MTPIRFFTDEDMYGAVAPQLRRHGFDAVSTPEAGRMGLVDADHLQWATQQGRVVVTFNVSDFCQLHQDWLTRGLHHAGIVVSLQRPIGDAIRRLINLAQSLSADDMKDRLEHMSSW
jgi:hypothetical protein